MNLRLFFFGFLLALASPPGPETYPGTCHPWVPVTTGAFGLPGEIGPAGERSPAGGYRGEEGFEALVYRGALYLGMEADNELGARLWRSRPGVVHPLRREAWEEVAADPQGNPFGEPDRAQNDHVDSLAAFQGELYVSTANRGDPPAGTRLYRSATGDPGTWEDALAGPGPGFGDPNNENFKDMQVFRGWLCGGTWNDRTGAQVWCTSDGERWSLQNRPGFADQGTEPANQAVWSGAVFDGGLYFGVRNTGRDPADDFDDGARLYRTRELGGEPRWELVYDGPPGSIRADLLGALGGHLYLALASPEGVRVLRSSTGDPDTWHPAAKPGLDGDPRNLGTVVDGAAVYNGALYMAVTNPRTGVQVWRTAGGDAGWKRIGPPGLGQPGTVSAELVPFHGELFAWTTNPLRGQGVLRTRCPACQRVTLPGRAAPGSGPPQDSVAFNLGGLELSVVPRAGHAESLEACFYPHLSPPGLDPARLPTGYFILQPQPPGRPLTADLEITAPAGGPQPGDRLQRWDGARWHTCPATGPPDHSCRGVPLAAPSIWAVAPLAESGSPGREGVAAWWAPLLGLLLLSLPYLLVRGVGGPGREF